MILGLIDFIKKFQNLAKIFCKLVLKNFFGKISNAHAYHN